MIYTDVHIESLGYELPPHVITSEDLEERLAPLYQSLHIQPGQLEAITGIQERRYWDKDYAMYQGALAAAKKALAGSHIDSTQIGMLIYGGVCRDLLEPATACAVTDGLGLSADTEIFDISNACLGVLTGMIQVANAIQLGHIRAGLVVSCESARQIVDFTIERMLAQPTMDVFRKTLATLTGGSGAVAVLLTHRELSTSGHVLRGGAIKSAAEHHKLCQWGPDTGIPAGFRHRMDTDSVGVLQHGVALGAQTYEKFCQTLAIGPQGPDKVVCHQVGAAHQKTILDTLGIDAAKDFTTFQFLGNMGTVSLPLTLAIAEERGFLAAGDLVGLLGIGSGLNCLMLGVDWQKG